jgi:hypothetical protein
MRPGAEPLPPVLQVTSDDRGLVFSVIAKLGDKLVLPPALDENSANCTSEEYHPATPPGES